MCARLLGLLMAVRTPLSEADLRALADAYGLGALASSAGVEAGTVNTSYRLETEKGSFFLRVYEEQGLEGARAEAETLGRLAASGVKTPPPVPDRDGALVRVVHEKAAALFPWVAGDVTCQRRVTAALTAKVGEALAALHLSGVGAPGPGRFDAAALRDRCARVSSSSDAEARELAPVLRARVDALDASRARDVPRGLVHGDLFRDNVLVGDDGEITALLDFESAHEGPFLYDVAVAILAWCWGGAFDPALARALVDGYLARRPLSEDERAGIFDELRFGCVRFTITRITDETWRVGKMWRRFAQRLDELEARGPHGTREALGL